jgi:hypothetical protein
MSLGDFLLERFGVNPVVAHFVEKLAVFSDSEMKQNGVDKRYYIRGSFPCNAPRRPSGNRRTGGVICFLP